MSRFEVIIVGGGLAGLSTAWHLARAGAGPLCVLEREWACGTRASGTNAAIFRHFEEGRPGAELAVRSRRWLDQLAAPGSLIRPIGALYLGEEARLARGAARLRALDVAHEWLADAALRERFPRISPPSGSAPRGVFVPGDGVVDVHGVLSALQADVVGLAHDGAFTVTLAGGERLEAPRLVLAGGAWCASLAGLLGLALPLEPRRRHLALLRPATAVAASHPVVWQLDAEVYFRPESGDVLASPCDEAPWPAGEVPVDPAALISLGERLGQLAPSLQDSEVRRAWGCLRTFAPDREFVAGVDPRLDGLSWLAGLGGRGVTCALAAGEVVAAAVLGKPDALHEALAPARLFGT